QQQGCREALQLAGRWASEAPAHGQVLFDALAAPFAVRALDMLRLFTRATIGLRDGTGPQCEAALASLEPYVPWQEDILEKRADCYERRGSALAARARSDLNRVRSAASRASSAGRHLHWSSASKRSPFPFL